MLTNYFLLYNTYIPIKITKILMKCFYLIGGFSYKKILLAFAVSISARARRTYQTLNESSKTNNNIIKTLPHYRIVVLIQYFILFNIMSTLSFSEVSASDEYESRMLWYVSSSKKTM